MGQTKYSGAKVRVTVKDGKIVSARCKCGTREAKSVENQDSQGCVFIHGNYVFNTSNMRAWLHVLGCPCMCSWEED